MQVRLRKGNVRLYVLSACSFLRPIRSSELRLWYQDLQPDGNCKASGHRPDRADKRS